MMSIVKFALIGSVAAAGAQTAANPIRKVVTLMQNMQKEIETEGEAAEELFEKFMCYCKNGSGDLQKSIDAANAKIPQLEASIKEAEGKNGQLKEDLKTHKADRKAAEKAIAEAEAIREKEATEYAKESGDSKANIAALTKAVAALEKGMGASFIQTTDGSRVKDVVASLADKMLDNEDKEMVASFLEQGYAPAGGEIVGILKQMGDQMAADLKEVEEAEAKAIEDFTGLKSAKNKEIKALTKSIEEKTERVGSTAVEAVTMKEDLEDTQEQLAEDTKFKADLEKNCATKKEEYDAMVQERGQELIAIGEAIKMLNDDDALDLFKSSLKTPETTAVAFLQKTDRSASKLVKARALIGAQKASSPAVALLQHALTSSLRQKKVDFSKVLKMIDDMVTLLGKEQKTDAEQKKYCEDELEKNDDTKTDLTGEVKSLDTSIAEMKDSIAVLGEEIAALQAKIADLDKSVEEASAQRKKEHAEFQQVITDNVTAMKLIEMAKNRLNKFYNPALYVPPPVEEMSAEDRIFTAAGGELQTTPAPTGLAAAKLAAGAFIQLSSKTAQPETPTYKKSGKSSSVIALMDGLISELKTGNSDMTHDEETAQKEYEEMLKDAEETRAGDSKSITDKQEAKASLEENLNEAKNTHKLKVEALADTVATIADLHKSCDFLLENFEVRLSARSKEIEGLKKAKAVLSGADYSLF